MDSRNAKRSLASWPLMEALLDENRVRLSPEQRTAVDAVFNSHNVFITGSGGVGKSFLVRHLYAELLRAKRKVCLCASTGIAAVALEHATTLHSLMGIRPTDDLSQEVHLIEPVKVRLQQMNVLVIDEISMVSAHVFKRVDQVLRVARDMDEVFGGVQVIVVGDFFQLPPVERGADGINYCFQTLCWHKLAFYTVELKTCFRQSDQEFIGMLQRVRVGEQTEDDLKAFRARVNAELCNENGVLPTQLFSRNDAVDAHNAACLDELPGKTHCYEATHCFFFDRCKDGNPEQPKEVQHELVLRRKLGKLKDDCQAPEKLLLKEGAQVLLVANINFAEKLVNGTKGIVVGLEDTGPKILWQHGVTTTLEKHSWTSEEYRIGNVRYMQIPLRLAWCITIHKSQGMTLDCACIDLGNIFNAGQAYVALSRVRSLQGITLRSFNAAALKVDPTVVEWYKNDYRYKDAALAEKAEMEVNEEELNSPSKKSKTPSSKKQRKTKAPGVDFKLLETNKPVSLQVSYLTPETQRYFEMFHPRESSSKRTAEPHSTVQQRRKKKSTSVSVVNAVMLE